MDIGENKELFGYSYPILQHSNTPSRRMDGKDQTPSKATVLA